MKFSDLSNLPRKSFYQWIFPTCLSLSFIFVNSNLIAHEVEQITEVSPCQSVQGCASRLHNINLMHNVLKSGEYQGYDLIIISSTTKEEADYQQQILEQAFVGTSKKNGREPIILSVVDSTDGGQLIGAIFTWFKAEERMREKHGEQMGNHHTLLEYVRGTSSKVAVFHNGGRGERCSPLTQSLGNSRGSQKLVGSVKNAFGEKIELEVLLGVILQCSSFALSNDGTHIDTFWTSQIAFGSHRHDELVRSNFEIDKFLVGFDKHNLIAQNITDFGTAALSKSGRMIAFYGNKRFASRKGSQYVIDKKKIETELLSKGDRVAYDFGSFTASLGMWQLLIDYWTHKNVYETTPSQIVRSKLKRDIDPHFIQPFIRLLYGVNDLANRQIIDEKLPLPSTLKTQNDLDGARAIFDQVLNEVVPYVHQYIWEEINQEKDTKKRLEAITCMNEVIEFYLLYRQSAVLIDLKKIFGFIDLGDDTQWFRYRRPIDIMNEKFEMLTDLIGDKIEVQLNGSIQTERADEAMIKRCCEARLMRGIKDNEIANFTIEGKAVTLTYAEVKAGITVEGVYVKNSIIQNCNLTRGSSIINSVVNHVMGKVIADHAYIESSISPLILANASLVHEAIDMEKVKADREVVSDVYRTKVHPPYQGRMRAPIGYDPKGMPIYKLLGKNENGGLIYSADLDETIRYFLEQIPYDLKSIKDYSDETARTEDGLFTFEEIRRIEPLRIADKYFRETLHTIARDEVIKNRVAESEANH